MQSIAFKWLSKQLLKRATLFLPWPQTTYFRESRTLKISNFPSIHIQIITISFSCLSAALQASLRWVVFYPPLLTFRFSIVKIIRLSTHLKMRYNTNTWVCDYITTSIFQFRRDNQGLWKVQVIQYFRYLLKWLNQQSTFYNCQWVSMWCLDNTRGK